jgi:hypothetical protein
VLATAAHTRCDTLRDREELAVATSFTPTPGLSVDSTRSTAHSVESGEVYSAMSLALPHSGGGMNYILFSCVKTEANEERFSFW